MATRVLLFTTDIRCLALGLAALTFGALTFLMVAALAVMTSTVSGTWLVVPSLVMVTGLAAVGAWLIFGDGARHFEVAPVTAEQWSWTRTPR